MSKDTIYRQAAIDAVQKYKCEHGYDYADCACDIEKDLKALPSAQPDVPDINDVDMISRQAAIDALKEGYWDRMLQSAADDPCIVDAMIDWAIRKIKGLPSAQLTLYGYNIEHLELIARVLQKEDLPPERVVETLTDLGRIVAIVRDEFEDALRKAVEQCTI